VNAHGLGGRINSWAQMPIVRTPCQCSRWFQVVDTLTEDEAELSGAPRRGGTCAGFLPSILLTMRIDLEGDPFDGDSGSTFVPLDVAAELDTEPLRTDFRIGLGLALGIEVGIRESVLGVVGTLRVPGGAGESGVVCEPWRERRGYPVDVAASCIATGDTMDGVTVELSLRRGISILRAPRVDLS